MKKKLDHTATVEEPMVAYSAANYTPMVAMMGDQYINPSDIDLLKLARKGIPKKSLLALAKRISLTIEEVASVLHISERTLQRYTPNTLVKTEYADRAIELALLYERGIEVLGSERAFSSWVKSPNMALGGEVPFNLLDTRIGFNMVLQILGRIEYGVFS
ncbi:type II RES/Xre toxin-antitoxin system antitoxin [Pedobacter mucosus]|uniref:type II RES/Xre toxin-antitoxin system antitoxin n=1 Tax=Pedobacter mucosus TaxID=2895286 RepID=UPI001EE48533|nr:antitoxin Xre/MbcA/ParS toxin-binding domain-containing protein [Pedobacter mucosus]UKT64443.1 MbcA/ParS/Xre antitoxin family protein [Pedobacter mucosus]